MKHKSEDYKLSAIKYYLKYDVSMDVVKTDDSYLFSKFTLLVAISNSKCVGYMFLVKNKFYYVLQSSIFIHCPIVLVYCNSFPTNLQCNLVS